MGLHRNCETLFSWKKKMKQQKCIAANCHVNMLTCCIHCECSTMFGWPRTIVGHRDVERGLSEVHATTWRNGSDTHGWTWPAHFAPSRSVRGPMTRSCHRRPLVSGWCTCTTATPLLPEQFASSTTPRFRTPSSRVDQLRLFVARGVGSERVAKCCVCSSVVVWSVYIAVPASVTMCAKT